MGHPVFEEVYACVGRPSKDFRTHILYISISAVNKKKIIFFWETLFNVLYDLPIATVFKESIRKHKPSAPIREACQADK